MEYNQRNDEIGNQNNKRENSISSDQLFRRQPENDIREKPVR